MAVPRTTRWTIEPHTKIKHLILQRYLHAWLPMMAKHNGRILFVDGFAGPGRYSKGEDGSPIIALKALLDHPHFQTPRPQREVAFLFIEVKEDRAAALKEEIDGFRAIRPVPDWVRIRVIQGEFAPMMTKRLDHLKGKGLQLAPTFAFIDPFGFAGVPLGIIARIVKNPRCECLITFMFEAINRFLSHPEPEIKDHFDQLFGTDAWKPITLEERPDVRQDKIINLYRNQLLGIAGLRYVRTFEMINQGNRTEYFLFFGTNNPKGLSKMKQALWRADPVEGEVFSDRTETDQLVLLHPAVNLDHLKGLLRQRFRGSGKVAIHDVERFVLEETPYSEAIHLRTRTLKSMELSKPPLIQVQRPSSSRNRPGEYPPGTRITFL